MLKNKISLLSKKIFPNIRGEKIKIKKPNKAKKHY